MNQQFQWAIWRLMLSTLMLLFVSSKIGLAQEIDQQNLPIQERLYGTQNLVAWCIVPFDASRRGPAERAKMVKKLGINRIAYDWRAEHVPTFEEEIIQYQKNGIEFFAFWSWHDSLEALVAKYKIRPQIWVTLASPAVDQEADRVRIAADSLMPLAEKTQRLGLKLALYNHGGWGGRPMSLVKVCEVLRERTNSDHVGIVYNFHHAHDDTKEFTESLPQLVPYLFCLNLNGMVDSHEVKTQNKKIVPIGSGKYELAMMKSVLTSGYRGPVGILDHRNDLDARESLQQNLDGLSQLIENW
ncbi:MAG: sugar phosphate isomerase/epimerase family protein [Mariniblastus sp.]